MAASCRVRSGLAQWDHHVETRAEIAALQATDKMSWQRLGQLLQRSSTGQGLSGRLCRCQMKSTTDPIGEVIVDRASDPAIAVRYYFAEMRGIRQTLGLHVGTKPSCYHRLGDDATRAVQNAAIRTAASRLASHHLTP